MTWPVNGDMQAGVQELCWELLTRRGQEKEKVVVRILLMSMIARSAIGFSFGGSNCPIDLHVFAPLTRRTATLFAA
ncbi:hypothetical protein ACO34A_05855 [Rhizobium sp. ACO-34A]|nr:hypothetical protein ACO34A_05855 [Rhizobium sp. ACO-34A]